MQATQRLMGKSADLEGRTLMEAMIGDVHIPPESDLRDGAAHRERADVVGQQDAGEVQEIGADGGRPF